MTTSSTGEIRTIITDQSAPGKLRWASAKAPDPGPGEALVRVGEISLNRGEVKTALEAGDGWRPGWDYAGVVARAAADGSGPKEGDRVVGLALFGAWSEYVAAPAMLLAPLPSGVGLADAATLPVAGLTARAALARGPSKVGRKVLITGASGGVGVMAIQLAALRCDVVTAAMRNPRNEDLVRALGAAHVVVGDSLAAARAQGPFDLILESVGGDSLAAALTLLAPGGGCVAFGGSSGALTTFDGGQFRVGGTSLYGLAMQYEFQFEPPSVGLAELAALMNAGSLKAVIERRGEISDIGTVADELIKRRFAGKAVLTVAEMNA